MTDIKWNAPPEHNDRTQTMTYDQNGEIVMESYQLAVCETCGVVFRFRADFMPGKVRRWCGHSCAHQYLSLKA